jgi:hypothetical protein
MDLFKPRGAATIRKPLDDKQDNGQIVNPPRFARYGGLDGGSKIGSKNKMTLGKPGDGRKVI